MAKPRPRPSASAAAGDQPPPSSLSDEIAAAQLAELNERVRMHATRLWQLPFAYVGVVALFLAGFDRDESGAEMVVASWFLAFLGILVVWAMTGAYEGIARGGREIGLLERSVGLRQTAGVQPDWLERLAASRWVRRLTWHFIPYFLMALLASATAIAAPYLLGLL